MIAILTVVRLGVQEPQPEPPRVDRRLIDLSADMLEQGEWQINLAGLFYSRGVLPWLSLSTSLLGDAATIANLSARFRLVNLPQLRMTSEIGGGYLVLGAFEPRYGFAMARAEVRATIPLSENWEMSMAPSYQLLRIKFDEFEIFNHGISWTSVLVRHDDYGSMYLQFTVPVLSLAQARLPIGGMSVSGVLAPRWVKQVTFLTTKSYHRRREGEPLRRSFWYCVHSSEGEKSGSTSISCSNAPDGAQVNW